MDPVQIVLLAVIIILAIALVVLGFQAFLPFGISGELCFE